MQAERILGYILAVASGAAGLWLVQRLAPALGAELWRYFQAKGHARRSVNLQLDPLLKACDELHGKLLSQAKEDFSEFRHLARGPISRNDVVSLCSTMFLFGQLWARFEILRRESFHAEFARDSRGATMLSFVQTLESRQMRLVDRAWQRAIGESLIVPGKDGGEIRLFRDFVDDYEASDAARRWFVPLAEILSRTSQKKVRQRLLRYGVVLHAMIDTLDKKHYTTKKRPGYANKLSRMSKHDLIYRVFGVYLPKVKKITKYVGTR